MTFAPFNNFICPFTPLFDIPYKEKGSGRAFIRLFYVFEKSFRMAPRAGLEPAT